MNILIRTDASLLIGSGHVMRCLVLANALQAKGFKLYFVMRPQLGDLIEFVISQGFKVLRLPSFTVPCENHSWLGVSSIQDANDFFSVLEHKTERVQKTPMKVNAVVVDHYGIDQQWETIVTQALGCKMVAIDDLVRQHNAHMVIDQTLNRLSAEYAQANMHPQALNVTGADFALLKPEFAQLHQSISFNVSKLSQSHAQSQIQSQSSITPAIITILVSMGGVDLDNVTLTVLNVLYDFVQGFSHLTSDVTVTVLLSRQSPHFATISTFCAQHAQWATHLDFVSDMATLISQHTLGVGAAGTSALERACLGLPSVIIPIADNQRTIAHELHQAQGALIVEPVNISTQLSNSLYTLLTDYPQFQQYGLMLTDGLGAERVAVLLKRLLCPDDHNIRLRRANYDDIPQVYHWQCEPQTRQFALEPAIPSWDEHEQWMRKQLVSLGNYFYIIEQEKGFESVGVIRIDIKSIHSYQLSIYVAPDYYHQGIATAALGCVDAIHNNVTIYATVLPDNNASQQLFHRAHYQQIAPDQFKRPPLG